MELSKILEELEKLPKGYISVKTIKGKEYFYLQRLENGKITSTYIKKNELERIKAEIERRKELESFLRAAKNANPISISPRAMSLTGYLMHEDKIVAKSENGHITFIDDSRAPLYIKRTKDIASYLSSRVLDLTRPNARFLLKQLGIDEKKEEYIALYAYGSMMQDHYWFKPLGSKKTFSDIRFDSDLFADASLKGKMIQLKGLGSPSPEFTNIGSFEKCWKKIDGQWWLYKAGKEDEILSEYFVYLLASRLGLPSAKYELDGEYIRSLNFAEIYDFEPMYSLMGDTEKYESVFSVLLSISQEIAKQYISLIWFDSIVYNVDRHNQNYGLLRDRKDGHIVSLAPNFDNNLALLAYNKTLDQNPAKEGFIQMFVKFIEGNEEASRMFKSLSLPSIDEGIVDEVLSKIPNIRDPKKIKAFVISRFEYLHELQVNL